MSSCIRTFTGKLVNPLDLQPEDIDPLDIAHALAFKCRFNGHVTQYYSVAEHSVHVSLMLSDGSSSAARLVGLLHDASECYLPDLPSPVKHANEMLEFRVAELRIMNAVATRFGVGSFDGDELHRVDRRMCATEARDLMNGGAVGYPDEYPPFANLHLDEPLCPVVAERLWLHQYFLWSGAAK